MGNGNLGGITAKNMGTVDNCYNTSDMQFYHNSVRSVGGIVAWNMKDGSNQGRVTNSNQYGYIYTTEAGYLNGESRLGGIIGHNQGYFDGTGSRGSWHYWYNKDNDKYCFKNYDGRVGKQG